jgi:ketosteroid isomerase-like protein
MKPVFDLFNLKSTIDILAGKAYGDLGLIRCTGTLELTPKAGGGTIHAMPDGKALTLYERQSDDSWKIVYDCFNSNVSPT